MRWLCLELLFFSPAVSTYLERLERSMTCGVVAHLSTSTSTSTFCRIDSETSRTRNACRTTMVCHITTIQRYIQRRCTALNLLITSFCNRCALGRPVYYTTATPRDVDKLFPSSCKFVAVEVFRKINDNRLRYHRRSRLSVGSLPIFFHSTSSVSKHSQQ